MPTLTEFEKSSIVPKVKDLIHADINVAIIRNTLLNKGIFISLSRLEWIIAMIKCPHIANYSFSIIQ